MDKAEPNQELSEDSTRESLIALSYGVPETDQAAAAAASPEKTTPVGDGDEVCRSELISISYSPSPDMKVQPVELHPHP